MPCAPRRSPPNGQFSVKKESGTRGFARNLLRRVALAAGECPSRGPGETRYPGSVTSAPSDQTGSLDPAAEPTEVDDLPEQLRVRREKRERLIASGHAAYPVWVDRTHSLGDIRRDWAHLEAGQETDATSWPR